MEPEFWHQRWQSGKIGFHEGEANTLLCKHIAHLNLEPHSRVFLPLCGKTRDIAWLLSQGHSVVGIELSQTAVEQLFAELHVDPVISEIDNLRHYSHHNIDIYAGDIFDLSADTVGPIDAIYDRAALVALPPHIRNLYTEHLINITHTASQFLICFEYDQSQMDGPPFSINEQEVKLQYIHRYDTKLIDSVNVSHGLRKREPATETVWLLTKKV